MTKMTQEEFAARMKAIEVEGARLKAVEVEGARRMQNAIITLLVMSGHMDVAPKILALNPAEVCKGESNRETLTLDGGR